MVSTRKLFQPNILNLILIALKSVYSRQLGLHIYALIICNYRVKKYKKGIFLTKDMQVLW